MKFLFLKKNPLKKQTQIFFVVTISFLLCSNNLDLLLNMENLMFSIFLDHTVSSICLLCQDRQWWT